MAETDRLRPHSVAAAAQLLELWLQRRAILDESSVDECLHLVQKLVDEAFELRHGYVPDTER